MFTIQRDDYNQVLNAGSTNSESRKGLRRMSKRMKIHVYSKRQLPCPQLSGPDTPAALLAGRSLMREYFWAGKNIPRESRVKSELLAWPVVAIAPQPGHNIRLTCQNRRQAF